MLYGVNTETFPSRLYVIQYTDIFSTMTLLLGTNGVVVSRIHCINYIGMPNSSCVNVIKMSNDVSEANVRHKKQVRIN